MEGDGYKPLVDAPIFDVRKRESRHIRNRKRTEHGKAYKLYSVLLNTYKRFLNYFDELASQIH